MAVKHMNLDGPSEEHYTCVPEEWVITEREAPVIKTVCAHHPGNLPVIPLESGDAEDIMQAISESLQILAEKRLWEQFRTNHPDVAVGAVATGFSEKEAQVVLAKIQHRMGATALEEAMSPTPGIFTGVPSAVLMKAGNEYIAYAVETAGKVGVIFTEHKV